MQTFQRILVPVDGSATADEAIGYAVNIALLNNSRIYLLYVSYFDGDTDNSVEGISWLPDAVSGSVTRASKLILGHARAMIPSAITVETYQETGIPSKTIVKFAEDHTNDLIVIGCRGLGIVEGFLLGSVSQYVLEHSKCPVLLIK